MKVTAFEKQDKKQPVKRPSVYPYNFVPLGSVSVPDEFIIKIEQGDADTLEELKEAFNQKGIEGHEVDLRIRPRKGRGRFKTIYRGFEL